MFHGGRIDVLGEEEDMKVVYLLEIEMRREDPVNNVVKIYRAIDKGLRGRPPKKIVFIHVFSAFYKRKLAKIKNATFAGKKMAEALENVEYKTIRWNLIPPVAGEEFPQDTEEQIQVLCNEIANIISLIVG
jgi:hypothetical protein